MGKLFRKLRIGEKIGVGFGIVGLLYLSVIWVYHSTLSRVLDDYHTLTSIYVAKKQHALTIQARMQEAQHAEKSFLLTRDPKFVNDTMASLDQAKDEAKAMGAIEPQAAPTAKRMTRLIRDYRQRLLAVVEAWRKKGLDHNSGLQGAFRRSVHELEDMAEQLKVDRLYLLLLQIRRGEKDLGLRREVQYRERVEQLIREFIAETTSSDLAQAVKARLFHEIEVYRSTFADYANRVLANGDIQAGKGPFRQAAHRIEDLLQTHYVPELGENILQVRRREKDYLLRLDKSYVAMTVEELDRIEAQVNRSTISANDKGRFLGLLADYRNNFLALVEQNDQIERLRKEMHQAVGEIVGLVRENVENANLAMASVQSEIASSTRSRERLILLIVAVATVLGVSLSFAITLPIVRPLRKMAGLLDRVASEEPTERIPYYSGGRDEVNAMAGSVNTMADHKTDFIAWWKASMGEADGCARLTDLLNSRHTSAERQAAAEQFHELLATRRELLSESYHKAHRINERIIDRTERLLSDIPSGHTEEELSTIRYLAKSLQTVLEMASLPEDRKAAAN